MKLLTVNTHSWLEDHQDEKFFTLVETILQEDYDVICLQEVNQLMTSQGIVDPELYQALPSSPQIHEDNYAYRLCQELASRGVPYYWSWAYNHIGYNRYHEGVALLSKISMRSRELLVSDVDAETDYHTRRLLLADLQVKDKVITVANLHLSWFGKGFEGEWAKVEEELLKIAHPLILMGDFNNPTDLEGYQLILSSSLKLQDSHKIAEQIYGNHTIQADIDGWEGNQQNFKVDHAFLSPDFQVIKSQIIFDGDNQPIISDHFGLEIEIN